MILTRSIVHGNRRACEAELLDQESCSLSGNWFQDQQLTLQLLLGDRCLSRMCPRPTQVHSIGVPPASELTLVGTRRGKRPTDARPRLGPVLKRPVGREVLKIARCAPAHRDILFSRANLRNSQASADCPNPLPSFQSRKGGEKYRRHRKPKRAAGIDRRDCVLPPFDASRIVCRNHPNSVAIDNPLMHLIVGHFNEAAIPVACPG